MSATITKAAQKHRQSQAEADKLLFRLASTGDPMSLDQRLFLIEMGRLDPSLDGEAARTEQRRLLALYERVARWREQAGLDGEFEAATEHLATVSVSSPEVAKELDLIETTIAELCRKRDAIHDAQRQAERKIDRMNQARRQLRDRRTVPRLIVADYDDRCRLGDVVEAKMEMLGLKEDVLHHEAAIAIDARLKSNPDRFDSQAIEFAESAGCVTRKTEGSQIIKSIDGKEWTKFVSEIRESLPECRIAYQEAVAKYEALQAEADSLLDFWLKPDPWGST